jgi:hypothetical protein
MHLHHFKEQSPKGHQPESRHQLADIVTRPQPVVLFEEQQESLLQWQAKGAMVEELHVGLP